MLTVKIDSKEINRILENAVSYSYGFLEGTEIDQILFNKRLGEFTVDALGKYIDSRARANPNAFHHVYEWNATGQESSRLFNIKSTASKRVIKFFGDFLESKSISSNSNEPFSNKAIIMENGIGVTIEPRSSDVLAFEVDGETVFSTKAIYIDHPGGEEVAGSFGNAVEDFFSSYFTNALLKPFIQKLSNPKEYNEMFSSGVKNGGKPTGIKSGKKYINSAKAVIE